MTRNRNGFAETDGPEENDGGPELRSTLTRAVARSLPWVILLVVLGGAIGLAVGLLQPNRYVSNAKLSLRVGAREQLTSESLVDLGERARVTLPTVVDELQMLSDAAIYEKVASDLGPRFVLLPSDPRRGDGPTTPWYVRTLHHLQSLALQGFVLGGDEPGQDELHEATKTLKENTVVGNEPGSSVILVTHTANTPEKARTIVQALTDAFIERHRAQFSIQSLLARSRSQLEKAKVARDEAAKAYVDQVSESGILVLESQMPRLEAEVSAIEAELFAARVRQEEIGRVRASLSGRLEDIPEEIEIQRPAVMVPNEEYETQLTLKRSLLVQKQQMMIENRPSEELRRREREFDRQIAKIDKALESMPRSVVQGSEMQLNLGHTNMSTRIVDLEVEEEALPVRMGLLESRLETKKARLAELQKKLLAATMMRKDLGAARDAQESHYAHVAERVATLESLESIDANEEANLRVLQAATLEPEKVGPRRFSLLVKGLLAGTIAALAFAILRQRFDPRLRYPETFERARGVPVIGVVPHLSSLRQLRARPAAGRS